RRPGTGRTGAPGPRRPRPGGLSPGVSARLRLRPRCPPLPARRARRSLRRAGDEPEPGRSRAVTARRRRRGGRFHPRRGGEGDVCPAPARAGRPVRALPRRRRGGGTVPRYRRLLAALAVEVYLRRPLARDRPPLGPDPQVAVLPADG